MRDFQYFMIFEVEIWRKKEGKKNLKKNKNTQIKVLYNL
jgi:hypothetical protein